MSISCLTRKTASASWWIGSGPGACRGKKARIDLWLKEIAPSDALRHRFHDNPAAREDFKTAYCAELQQPPAQSAVRDLLNRLSREPVTLLFAARDETRNNAAALKEWLEERGLSPPPSPA